MHAHFQVFKPASSKRGNVCCQQIVGYEGKGLPTILAAAVPTTTSAAGPLLLGFGLIDLHRPAIAVGAIKFLDSLLRLAIPRHLDKGKALALTRITICDDVDRINRAALAKRILQLLLVG